MEGGILKLIKMAVVAISLALPAVNAVSQEFRLLSSWDKEYAGYVHIAAPFQKGIETASQGRMKFTASGPETVPPFEQLQPLSSGVFQFLFTVGVYHFGTTPVLSVVDALDGDYASIRASGIAEAFDRHYQKFGVKIIALPISAEGGFHVILKQPVGPSGDLQGRKIRVTPNLSPVINMLNGVPVLLPAGEIYTALDKGVVDGASWPVIGALGFRWNEVAKYLLRPAYGIVAHPMLMNLATWNKLSEADRKIIMQEARKVEESWVRDSARLAQAEEKELLARGMSVTQMGEAQKAKLRDAYQFGLWELAATKNAKDVGEIRDFARSKKLAR
jgi:TRAP-type C4-dicarboxylate transport system substrate-binding protein